MHFSYDYVACFIHIPFPIFMLNFFTLHDYFFIKKMYYHNVILIIYLLMGLYCWFMTM